MINVTENKLQITLWSKTLWKARLLYPWSKYHRPLGYVGCMFANYTGKTLPASLVWTFTSSKMIISQMIEQMT